MTNDTMIRPDRSGPQPERAPIRPGPLGRLAAVAYRRRGRVVLAWVAGLALAGVVILSLFGLAVGKLINVLEARLLHWR